MFIENISQLNDKLIIVTSTYGDGNAPDVGKNVDLAINWALKDDN